jgi:hypothetical protein
MATTTTAKKTAAKKTAAKKTTARKTTAKKTAAKKTAAKKTAATKTAAPTAASVTDDVQELVEDATKRFEESVDVAARFARDAAFVSLGTPFVIQDRIVERNFELVDYRTFLDQAKAKGEVQFEEIRSAIEPITDKFTQTVEPIVERIEENLPKQVKDVVDANRARMRELLPI